MKTLRNILIFIVLIGTIAALAPAGAFYAIHMIDKNYALRVNAFSNVQEEIDDYYIIAGIITSRIEDGSVSVGDTLLLKDKQIYKKTDGELVSLNVSTEQGLSIERALKFSYSHNTVRVYKNMYHFISGTSGVLVDSLAYSKSGSAPDKQDPTEEDVVYYAPKKIDNHFYVLVRDPKPDANYFKEGFEIVEWGWQKVKAKFFS